MPFFPEGSTSIYHENSVQKAYIELLISRSSLCSFKAESIDPISNRAHPMLECKFATNSFLLFKLSICFTFLRQALASCKLSDGLPSARAEIVRISIV